MEELRQCIATAMGAHSSPGSRDAANRQLYAFQNDPHSIAVCVEGFQCPHRIDPGLMSFLMNAAKTQVVLFHDRWPANFRTSLRHAVLDCCAQAVFSGPQQQKAAHILVELAVREWPQLWPDAFDLVHQWLKEATTEHLALLFLSTFINALRCEAGEEITGGWTLERKAEVAAAFNEVLPGFTQWLLQCRRQSAIDPLAVHVYGQLVGWAKLEQHDRLVDWCLDLVSDPRCQEEALEALLELSNRTFHSACVEDCKVMDYVVGEGLRKVNVLLEGFVGTNYFLFRQLVDIVTSVLSRFCGSDRKDAHVRAGIQSAILDIQLYLSHPSLYVRSALVMCMLDVFKTGGGEDHHGRLVEETIEQALPLLVAILAEDPAKAFQTADNQHDFDDLLEYHRTFEHLKARIGDMIGRMSGTCPALFLRLLDRHSMKLLGAASSNKWQMAVLFLIQHYEQCPSGAAEDDSILREICGRVVSLLQQNIAVVDCKLVEEALYALKSLCLAMHSQGMYGECYKVFAHFAAVQGDSCLQVRCRSMACLYQMAVFKPELFLDLMSDFLQLAGSVKGQRELRTWIETVLLMAAQEHSFPVPTRMHFFKAVFVPLVAQVEGSACRHMADAQTFADFVGLFWYLDSAREGKEPEAAKRNRIDLVNTLTLLQVASKGVRGMKALDGAIVEVVTAVFIPTLLNTLALLSGAQLLSVGHANYAKVFQDLPGDCDGDVGVGVDGEGGAVDKEAAAAGWFKYLGNWISHVRAVCFTSLGHLCQYPFDHSKVLVGFDHLACLDRTALVRCALTPIVRQVDDVAFTRPLIAFCREDFKQPVFYDADMKRAGEWLATFCAFACDVVMRKGSGGGGGGGGGGELYEPLLDLANSCIQNGAPGGVVSKWSGFLSEHIDKMVLEERLWRPLFSTLATTVLSSIARRADTHTQMLGMLADLFRHNTLAGLYQVDHLLVSLAKLGSAEVDRLRAIFASPQYKSKAGKFALQTSLQPLLRQACPSTTQAVKKIVPDKLVILSKLRRSSEKEQIENQALSHVASIFNE